MKTVKTIAKHLTILASIFATGAAEACTPYNNLKEATTPSAIVTSSDDKNFESALDLLGGEANFYLPDVSYPGETVLKDRILHGFESAPPPRKLSNGMTIFWGFKYKEATYKSVAITDNNGNLCMIGAVTNVIPLLSIGSTEPNSTNANEYNSLSKKYFIGPASIVLVVKNDRDLQTFLPIIKRWTQALLLSFTANCDEPAYKAACNASQEIKIPTYAYQVKFKNKKDMKSAELKELPVPNLPASSIPIKAFY